MAFVLFQPCERAIPRKGRGRAERARAQPLPRPFPVSLRQKRLAHVGRYRPAVRTFVQRLPEPGFGGDPVAGRQILLRLQNKGAGRIAGSGPNRRGQRQHHCRQDMRHGAARTGIRRAGRIA